MPEKLGLNPSEGHAPEFYELAPGILVLEEMDASGNSLCYLADPATRQKLNPEYGFKSIQMVEGALVAVGDHAVFIINKRTGEPCVNTYTHVDSTNGVLWGLTNDQISSFEGGKRKLVHEKVAIDPDSGNFYTKSNLRKMERILE